MQHNFSKSCGNNSLNPFYNTRLDNNYPQQSSSHNYSSHFPQDITYSSIKQYSPSHIVPINVDNFNLSNHINNNSILNSPTTFLLLFEFLLILFVIYWYEYRIVEVSMELLVMWLDNLKLTTLMGTI